MSNPIPQAPPPFSMTYSPALPELLIQLNCSLAISTYQAGKVVFISPRDENRLVQLPRSFHKAMGISFHEDKMLVATKSEVVLLKDSPDLGFYYPKKPETYDTFYLPRATYYTGMVDIHDIDFGADGIYGVNTSFSCIAKIDAEYSFTPVWKPHFISELAGEDRCHLNGMAMVDGKPKYVTAFGSGDAVQSWRSTVTETGILMDVDSNEIISQGLKMPHSPRLFDGQLYLLFSATGELVRMNLKDGTYDVVCKLNGFVRGLARHGDYAFIGLSKLRKNSSTFAHLPVADMANHAGIAVVHLPTGALAGELRYQSSVDEIYDVQVLPGRIRPGILNTEKAEHKLSLHLPDATFWANPPED